MRQLNVAIIGQGRSGYSIHGAHFLTDDRFKVVCVADELEERREKARRAFGCDVCENYEYILSRTDVDLVVNASFSYQHYPITLNLIRHGINVVSEKPFAATPEQVDVMIKAAEASGAMLAPFQQSRLAPYFLKIREIISSGVLGRIVSVNIAFSGFARRWDWQTMQKYTGGSLYNTGPHPLDQALALLGGTDMPQVFCKMDRAATLGDAEDYVKLILTAPGKPLVDLEISSANAYPWGTYNVQGTRGGLWASAESVKWRWFEPGEAPKQRLTSAPLTTDDGEPAYCREVLPWKNAEWTAGEGENAFVGAVRAFYDNIYAHITTGEELIITPEQVRRQIAVIRLCHEMNPLDKFC